MKALSLLALVALVVVSCHIDKLLTGGKTPPSDAPPASVAFSSSLGSARAGEPITPPVKVTAYDSLGNKVTNFTGLVGVTLGNDGSVTNKATLSGGDPVPAVAGVATFSNLRIDQVGAGYTLRAAFGTATPVGTSTGFAITPGPPPPATHLAFTQQPPQTTRAGAAIAPPVQVAALDAAEHVVQ